MNIRHDIEALRRDIDGLLSNYPELADDEALRADVFEGETDLSGVLARLVDMSGEAAAMSEAIKLRLAAMSERKARYDRKEEAMRSLIQSVMERAGLVTLTLPEATLSVRHIPPSPVVSDATQLPDDCVKIERKPDLKAIRDKAAAGVAVPGTVMGNGRNSLTIRIK